MPADEPAADATARTEPPPGPLGTVARCWRYPVKSLQGLEPGALEIGPGGVIGDRTHALVDPVAGHLLSAKRTSALLQGAATDNAITLPDGTAIALDDPDADDVLSAWLGKRVHLAALEEAGERTFEMTFDPPNDDAEYYEIPAPAGSFLDLAHVHLVTTATLDGCRTARPDLDWDVRRFRPNILLDVPGEAFVEGTWAGRHMRVGTAVLAIDGPTVRCAMPLRAQPGGIEREPGLFQAMNELNTVSPNHLGAYCSVVEQGRAAPGDPVELL